MRFDAPLGTHANAEIILLLSDLWIQVKQKPFSINTHTKRHANRFLLVFTGTFKDTLNKSIKGKMIGKDQCRSNSIMHTIH
jgi:hypothetical protein